MHCLSEVQATSSEVQTVLKAFDAAREWPDVMKCIQRLQKALEHKKYERFEAVPEKLTLCKRLAQCLNQAAFSGKLDSSCLGEMNPLNGQKT